MDDDDHILQQLCDNVDNDDNNTDDRITTVVCVVDDDDDYNADNKFYNSCVCTTCVVEAEKHFSSVAPTPPHFTSQP